MNRPLILAAAIASFGLALFNVILGLYLVPTFADLTKRSLVAPWYVIWLMIGLAALSAVTLGVFLLTIVAGRASRSAAH